MKIRLNLLALWLTILTVLISVAVLVLTADAVDIRCPWTVPDDGEGGRCTHYVATLNGDRFPMTLIPGNPGDTQAVVVEATEPGLYQLALAAVDREGVIGPADTVVFVIRCGDCGDVNGDGSTNIQDASILIDILFRGGICP